MEKEETCYCAVCPLCDLRFPATSLLGANIGLSEHLLRHARPNLKGDDLIGAYIDAERNTYSGGQCSPSVLKDRTPSPKDSTEIEPPVDIPPEHLWREQRMYELIACINRYHESGFPVKPEWLEELRSILVASRFLSVLKETK